MHIRQNGQLKQAKPRAATTNAVALTIIEVAVPTARFTDVEQLGELHRYVGHEVEITLRANPLPPAAHEPKPMDLELERAEQNGHATEHTRPGPTEACSECGRVIGDDPQAAFYAPLAGPSRPVCGPCALELDDREIAAEGEGEAALAEEIAAVDNQAEPGSWQDIAERGDAAVDEPLEDGPMAERPADTEPVTSPIRRGRVRAASVE